jgi:MFS transporter, OFA family, oxalate/formate antiporter
LLVPLANVLVAAKGNWHAVFVTAALMNAAAALLAWFVLKPMRDAHVAQSAPAEPAPAAA